MTSPELVTLDGTGLLVVEAYPSGYQGLLISQNYGVVSLVDEIVEGLFTLDQNQNRKAPFLQSHCPSQPRLAESSYQAYGLTQV